MSISEERKKILSAQIFFSPTFYGQILAVKKKFFFSLSLLSPFHGLSSEGGPGEEEGEREKEEV